ncbi:hypothetical protein RHGRI_004107 [Rhododendron griersonianum]|uniref:Uncharacterized protein n=1 Tax=Rhododendron griersonianum TaxID=479676 RepID=A0AAV6L7D3_9ERIC|nr:hypothetical protein RHGRI_004107 [Rhododendron griersonianum]
MNTLVAIPSISLLPLKSTADLSLPFVVGLFQALVPSIMMNLYAVGLNQLTDVEIDKVNKPYLPLASGEISTELGIAITFAYLLTSFAMGVMFQSPPLLSALLVRFLLMTAYSVQFVAASLTQMEKKRVPRCNMHIDSQGNGQRSYVHTHSVAFMCLFSTIIALSKDIEDVDGDREHGIQSLAVILGKEKVFWLCISMLLIGYGCAMVIGASSSFSTTKFVTVLGHCVLASTLCLRAWSVDLDNKASISSFYMLIWKASDRITSGQVKIFIDLVKLSTN